MPEGNQSSYRKATVEDEQPSSTGPATNPATHAATVPSVTATAPLSIYEPPRLGSALPKSSLPIVPLSLNSGRAFDPSVSPESPSSSSSSSQSPQHLGLGLSNIIGRIYSTSRHPSQATRPIWPIEGPSETDSSNSNITQPGSGLPVTQREAGSPNQVVPETSSLSQLSRGSIYDLLPPYDATGYYESEHEPGRQFGGVKAYRNVPQTQIQDAGFGDNFPSQPTDIEDIVQSPRARFRSSDRRRPFRSPSPIPPPYRSGPV